MMKGMQLLGCLVLAGMISLCTGESDDVERFIRESGLKFHLQGPPCPDCGYFNNCGPASHNFTMSWKPKQLAPRGPISVSLDITAPCDWDQGTVVLKVFLPLQPDEPILQDEEKANCAEGKKYEPTLKCPMKKGEKIHMTYTSYKLPELPSGPYIIQGELYNAKKEQFICARAEIDIKG